MTTDSRDKIRQQYSAGGDKYDDVRLSDPRGALLSEHDVRLFRRIFAPGDKTKRLLEVGAGTGRFTLPVLEAGYEVVATDINEAMLEELQRKIEQKGLADRCEVQKADVFNLSFESEAFDYVFSLHVIPRFLSLEDQQAALTEIARVIKPGGRLLFNYRNSTSAYRWLYKGYATTPREMQKILADAGMRIIDKRGKWFLSRKLANTLPLFAGAAVSRLDRCLERFWPDRAWDVFVVAVKQ